VVIPHFQNQGGRSQSMMQQLNDIESMERSISVDFILKIFCPYNLKSLSILLETHKIKIDR